MSFNAAATSPPSRTTTSRGTRSPRRRPEAPADRGTARSRATAAAPRRAPGRRIASWLSCRARTAPGSGWPLASLDCAHPKNVLRGEPIECLASNERVTGSREKRSSDQPLNAAPEDGLFHGQQLDKKIKRAAEPSPAVANPL